MKYKASLMLTAAALTAAASVAQQPATGRSITGRVLGPQATPVAEVEVCAQPLVAFPHSVGRWPPCVHSDAGGRFSIPVEVSTTYFLTAKKESEGYPYSHHVFYRVPYVHLNELAVADGQSPPEVTLQLGPPVAQLTGSITDAKTGRPVNGARVRLCRTESPKYCATFEREGPSVRYTAGADGRYTVAVPPSPMAVEVMAEGYEDWAAPEPLRFTSGEQSELNVALRRPGRGASVLPAPRPKAPADGAVLRRERRMTVLEWSPVEGAAGYQIEVEFFYRCPEAGCPKYGAHELAGDPPQYGLEETRYEFQFIGAQPGRWRVRALDAKGRAGAKSAWINFTYGR
jgi:hypothetical protein